MTIRPVTVDDAEAIRRLWEAFDAEIPQPPGYEPETWDEAWADLRRHAAEGVALIAEDDEGAAGFVFATALRGERSHITDVYVRPDARGSGLGTRLMAEVAGRARELGARWISLNVATSNRPARTFYERLGFEDVQVVAAVPLEALAERAAGQAPAGASVGAVLAQTDDQAAIAKHVGRFVPRLFRSQATAVSAPRNGWVSVTDAVWEHDPELVGQLAQELSHVTGSIVIALAVERGRFVRLAAYERGSLMDEYLSVPGAYGPIAAGDAVALRANPTVLGRLTGADPGQIRAVARVAETEADLPPAPELAEQLAGVLGLSPPRSFAEAKADPEAVVVAH
jgi:ribosomal protein S18 acetylase RimI-like enzyme